MIVYVLSAYLMADLFAGFWHWLEDRYFDTRWPLIGEYVAKPNELHHSQPTAFLFNTYWGRNWTSIVPAAVLGLLALGCGQYWWAIVMLFVSQANEIHAMAHRKGTVPRWVETLQMTGLLQSPRHHAEHHRSPFEIRYCVMSDWLNPFLDAFGFWRGLEWIVAAVFRIEPK